MKLGNYPYKSELRLEFEAIGEARGEAKGGPRIGPSAS